MSIAQIELMCADCSVTVYPKTDTVKDGKGKEHKFERPSAESLRNAVERYEASGSGAMVDLSGFNF